MQQALSFLTYPKQVLRLAFVAMLVLAGFSFLWPLTSLYVTQELGGSLTTAGMMLSLEAACGIVGSLLGGVLYDRMGGKRLLVAATLLVVLSSLLLASFKQWSVFLGAFLILMLSIGALMTAIPATTGLLWPEGGRTPFNFNYVCQNIGVALGTMSGGLVASVSFTYAFLLNGLFFTLALCVIIFGLHLPQRSQRARQEKETTVASASLKPASSTRPHHSRHLLALLLLGLGTTCNLISYIQWQTTVPVYMIHLHMPLHLYSFLWTLNGLLVLLLQPLNALLLKKLPDVRTIFLIGESVFLLSYALLLWHTGYGFFMGAMVLATMGEILIWPTVPALAARFAPPGREGFFQGTLNAFNYGGRLIGPLAGTALYQYQGAGTMFAVMVCFYMLALLSLLSSKFLSR